MPIGCGYHCFAHAKRIGERTGNNLRLVRVRSDINICHPDKLQQIFVGNKTIMKNDVLRNTEFCCAYVKVVSVILPLFCLEVRMGSADHHINNLRVGIHDLRKGVDDHLNALARRKQSKGQDDLLSGYAEPVLVGIGFDKRDVRDAMVYEDDLLLRHLVDIAQEIDRALAHHHQPVRELGKLHHDLPLLQVRILQERVQSRHDRHLEITQQLDDKAATLATENAIFMLETDHVCLFKVEQVGCQTVFIQLVLVDLEPHFRRIEIAFGPVVHRDRPTGFVRCIQRDRFKQVRSERGDTTLPGEVITNEDDGLESLPFWSRVSLAEILYRSTGLTDSVV